MKRKMKNNIYLLLIILITLLSCTDDSDENNNNKPIITSLKITNLSSYNFYDVKYSSTEFGNIAVGDNKTIELQSNNTSLPVFFTLMVNGNPVQCKTNDIKSIAEGNKDDWIIYNSNSISTITGGINGTLSFVYNTLSKPILELSQNNNVIENNNPAAFNFGNVELTTNNQMVFTIKNIGNLPLELYGDPAIESSNPVFTIPSQLTSTIINPGISTSFLIRYTPTDEKEDSGNISILNNSDDVVFILNVKGTGYVKKPQIAVRQGNTAINQNGEYNFGSVFFNEQKDVVFTIANNGEAPLIYETIDNNRINLINNAQNHFLVISQPSQSMTVAPGSTNTFTVRFKPASTGNNFSVIVKIKTNSKSNDEFAFTLKGSSELASPSGVTAVYQEPKSILVSWNPVPGAVSYNVYYGMSSTAVSILAGSALTETSFTHTGLSDGTTYFYCVTAKDNITESGRSQTVSRITMPGIPANLRSTAVSSNSVTLAWNVVTGAASYRIYSAATINGTKTQVNTITSGTSSTITGLSANTTQYYFVTAVNASGESFHSDVLAVKTLLAAPSGVTATSQSVNSINLTWNAVQGALSYKVYYGTSNSTINILADGAVSGTSFTHNGLSAGTTYFYCLTAHNDSNESDRSQIVSRITIPGIPTNLRTTAVSFDNLTLAWNAVTGAASYRIYRASTITGTKTQVGTTSSGSTFYHTGLTANTTNYYFVTAVNASGESSYSDALTVKTLLGPLAAPTNVKATAQTTSSIQVTWGSVSGAARYNVYRATSANGSQSLLDTVTTTSYTNTGLSQMTYWYFITSVNSDGVESAFSASTSMIPKPNAPGNVTARGVNNYLSIDLSWSSVQGVSSYNIYCSTSSTGTKEFAGSLPSYSTSGSLNGLEGNTRYYVWVTAVNSAGESEFSSSVTAITAPAAPANLRITATTTSTATLAWNAVPGATRYDIYHYRNGGYFYLGSVNTNSEPITGLESKSFYMFGVSAYSGSTGLNGPLSEVSVTTR